MGVGGKRAWGVHHSGAEEASSWGRCRVRGNHTLISVREIQKSTHRSLNKQNS